MADGTPGWAPLNVINPWSSDSLGPSFRIPSNAALGASSSAANVANEALFFPFRIYVPTTAVKMSYIVGSTANGNVDLGIYDWQKNLLVSSGSTAQGSINTLQTIDITDTKLAPGRYFMAYQGSSGTGTAFGVTLGTDEASVPLWGLFHQAVGSFGLPTTAAFVTNVNATPRVIVMGVHFDTLV